jgi:glucose/arabinose dehydrogenase
MPLELEDGASISFFAKDLEGPRDLVLDSKGTILVSTPRQGKVLALPDKNNDGASDETVTVAEGLNLPHGLAFDPSDETKLYIAETDQVAVYDYDPPSFSVTGKRKIADLPSRGVHFTRSLLFMPAPDQDRLLISVGSSCNVCYEEDQRRARILVVDVDGGAVETFASGLRNSVFMAVRPGTGEIWATEMGRDLLGDDVPPDEINIVREGGDYGWPVCYGKNVHDDDFDPNPTSDDPCGGKTPSHIDIQAHSAPLGLAFFPERGWPAEYEGDLAVAYHGSWNRSVPTGYKVVRFELDSDGGYKGFRDMITGWLESAGDYVGRPVDILFDGGGTMFISDDYVGVVYRVSTPGARSRATDHISVR